MFDELVVAGGEDAFVEELVGAVVIDAAVHRPFQRVTGQQDRVHLFAGCALAGPAHGHRLDGAAQVEQIVDEVFRQAAARQPADDLWIEEIPAPYRQHPRADFRPDLEHAFGNQGLDGFTDDRAAHAELFAEVGFDLE
ncbi:hypothetical protein D3C78_1145290 [compost metagenome]